MACRWVPVSPAAAQRDSLRSLRSTRTRRRSHADTSDSDSSERTTGPLPSDIGPSGTCSRHRWEIPLSASWPYPVLKLHSAPSRRPASLTADIDQTSAGGGQPMHRRLSSVHRCGRGTSQIVRQREDKQGAPESRVSREILVAAHRAQTGRRLGEAGGHPDARPPADT